MYRTRDWRRYQDHKNVKRWQFILRSVFCLSLEEVVELKQHSHWTFKKGLFRKYSLSCDHHAICNLARAERKFRYDKLKFYRQLDQKDSSND